MDHDQYTNVSARARSASFQHIIASYLTSSMGIRGKTSILFVHLILGLGRGLTNPGSWPVFRSPTRTDSVTVLRRRSPEAWYQSAELRESEMTV